MVDSVRPQLESLFELGSVAGLSDGQLLDRVEGSAAEGAEVAFAALVERHGPMVLRVCRDLTGNPHDAEDACQAVFLVLARRSRSVQRRESAASWLFGVARKVAARARRDEARRREHEKSRAEQVARRDQVFHPAESWPELHEEIDRLPANYREAVVLHHLEGLSHEAAAARLRCPLRTFQSRLLRARSRLRDGLVRRGVSTGDGAILTLLPDATKLAARGPIARSVARLALSFAHGQPLAGEVPVAIVSLAEGVLRMSFLSRIGLASSALMAVGLTTGLAWAAARGFGDDPDQPTTPPASTQPAIPPTVPPVEVQAHGVVVDEGGQPVAGTEVFVSAFDTHEARGTAAADGSFAIPVANRHLDNQWLLARSPGSDLLGVFHYGWQLTRAQLASPVRVVVQPPRRIKAHVRGADGQAVAGAIVEVIGVFQIFAEATTDAEGLAALVIPADARVEQVVALKWGQGIDYAEFGPIDHQGIAQGGVAGLVAPLDIPLTITSARTVSIRAVDPDGQPLAGVSFSPWLIQKEGRRSQLNIGIYPHFTTRSDPDGFATFNWLPRDQKSIIFWPTSERFTHRRVIVATNPIIPFIAPFTTTLTPTETIRGRVLGPDGRPAASIRIRAGGTGIGGNDHGGGQARTNAEGFYEIRVEPGEGYAVAVDDEEWVAPSRLDVVVQTGKPTLGVDFALTRGTIIRGTVTVHVGGEDQPAPNKWILFSQIGASVPSQPDEQGRVHPLKISRQFGTETDAQGHYSIRVGPGTYTLFGPSQTGSETIVVSDEAELVRDFRMP